VCAAVVVVKTALMYLNIQRAVKKLKNKFDKDDLRSIITLLDITRCIGDYYAD
jgi:hypothetical protein